MRRAKRDERAALAALMFEQFYEQAELQQQFSGIDPETAHRIGPIVLGLGQGYFFAHGDVFVCDAPDGSPAGVIAGADAQRLAHFGPLGQFFYALRHGKELRDVPRPLLGQIMRNSRPVLAAHSTKWYRRYCGRPYYLAQFGVAKPYRGTGVARDLLEGAIEHAAANGYPAVVLETFLRENVPMYMHFGFQLKQAYENNGFTEYRLLLPLMQLGTY
nr:GNAT family N-acetyltransferase [uncultured Agathobaculum sp.]